uniref:G-protein coupled receptors family 1 profile domain-containing protein n=1 Tax=Gopherus agassizii TaxID=38772 RepID=A0A452IX19_9SAUR
VLHVYGLLLVLSDQTAGNGTQRKDYCTHFNYTDSAFCSPHSHLSPRAFRKSMPTVMWGNCSLCEKGRLAQLHGAQSLLVIVRETVGSFCTGDVIAIPMVVLLYSDMLDIRGKKFSEHPLRAAIYLLTRSSRDDSMKILLILAVSTIMTGGYWAELVVAAKPQHTDNVLLAATLLYCFHNHFVCVVIGIFCCISSKALYSCISPFVRRILLGE